MFRVEKKISKVRCLCLLAGIALSSSVYASNIIEVEPNNHFSSSQLILPEQFSKTEDADVANSLKAPHVTISADKSSSYNYDYYRIFMLKGMEYVLDIDYGYSGTGSFNSYLEVYNPSKIRRAYNDNASTSLGSAGSTHSYDSFLKYTATQNGIHYIRISRCCTGSLPNSATYKLSISINSPDADFDGDGIPDAREAEFGTDIKNPDSDGDGMPDGWEVQHNFNPEVDDSSLDSDGDGYSNLYESQNGGNPRSADHDFDGVPDDIDTDDDNDGLSDSQERTLGTNPFKSDTDSDGWSDSFEDQKQLDPLVDDRTYDVDSDKLTNLAEIQRGTNHLIYDTDGDALGDGDEVNIHNTDPKKKDTDDDELDDGYEINQSLTNARVADTDGDKMLDGWEVKYGLNPLVSTDDREDVDKDGWLNIQEYENSTNPIDIASQPNIGNISGIYSITGSRELIKIDLETGKYKRMGSRITISDDYEGLAINPINGNMYAAGDSSRGLYQVQPETGVARRIGTLNGAGSEYGLSFDNTGKLYLIDGENLFQVNTNTAETRLISRGSYGDGLAWHKGNMYSIGESGSLRKINLDTGAITVIGELGISRGAQSGLASAGDKLIGLNESGGKLFSINTQTGKATLLSNVSTDIESLAIIFTSNSDNDSISDTWEEKNGLDSNNPDDAKVDTDNDGLINLQEFLNGGDPLNPDSDNDGLSDGDEYFIYRTNLKENDSDSDGVLDGYEVRNGLNPLVNDANSDLDSDGLSNLRESQLKTAANKSDTDNDGLNDRAEVDTHSSNPLLADTDSDGMKDGWEAQHRLNLKSDDSANDIDGDNLTNLVEHGLNTNPRKKDSDNDGLDDDVEVNTHGTNPALADTDKDGLNDGLEINIHQTNPKLADSDSDGMPDGWEIDEGLNPKLADADTDTDGDSLSNLDEFNRGTSAKSKDSDNDGIADADDTDNKKDNGAPTLTAVPQELFMSANAADYQRGKVIIDNAFIVNFTASDKVDRVLDYRARTDNKLLSINNDDELLLPTGRNVVSWTAVDAAGNESNAMEQIINVYPRISFAKISTLSGEGTSAEIEIRLSGPSPDYPVTIEVAVNASRTTIAQADVNSEFEIASNKKVIIQSGDNADEPNVSATLTVRVLSDSVDEEGETIGFDLLGAIDFKGDTNWYAVEAEKNKHDLTITENNLAPVVVLMVSQAGNQVDVINSSAGEVTIGASISDPNGADTHVLAWEIVKLGLSSDAVNQNKVVFDPSQLPAGEYVIAAIATDNGDGALATRKDILLKIEAVKTTTPQPSPAAPKNSSSKSSGGEMPWVLLFILTILAANRRPFKY